MPILDREIRFDDRSRQYSVSDILKASAPRTRVWKCGINLDQGQEGACVGFGWSHEAAATPVPVRPVTNEIAFNVYSRAKQLDEYAGENYEGSSVLGGVKTVTEKGWVKEYRWAFNPDDALIAISHHGPAVIGVNWYEDMFDLDAKGFLHASGKIKGGHCILVRGVDMSRNAVVLHNSWGSSWGGTKHGPGTAFLSFSDFNRLLSEDGECCIPTDRPIPKKTGIFQDFLSIFKK